MRAALTGLLVRLFADHSIPIATMVAMAWLTLAVMRADSRLREVGELNRGVAAARARLAAEEAAYAAVHAGQPDDFRQRTSWGLDARVRRVDDGRRRRLEITVRGRGERRYRFGAMLLDGAAPACFGMPLTIGDHERQELPGVDWIEPRAAVLGALGARLQPPVPVVDRSAVHGLQLCAIEPDPTIACLVLPHGTDAADFVFGGARAAEVRPEPPPGGAVLVPGNLWLAPAAQPLLVFLEEPLTIAVEGNVYLCRSVRVLGTGTLTLLARFDGGGLRDLDGDGRRSPGEPVLGSRQSRLEGSGSVYLGQPGPALLGGALGVAANVVAAGEVHVVAAAVEVSGAVVAGTGVTRCHPDARLVLTGELLDLVDRRRIPGFQVEGAPRPGRLRPLPEVWRPR